MDASLARRRRTAVRRRATGVLEVTKRECLITGASGLLGSAWIARYASKYAITAVHRTREIEFATQDQSFFDPLAPRRPLDANDHAVHAVRADLATEKGCEQVVGETIARTTRLDLLLSAATVRMSAPLTSAPSLAAAEHAFALDVLAPLRLAAALVRASWGADPAANAAANRSVVLVAGTAGRYVYEDQGLGLHSATSAALCQLVYHLASELWHLGIRVNGVLMPTNYCRDDAEKAATRIAGLDAGSATGTLVTLTEGP
ncbi:SDR family oxidoreductase [Nannocystis punicea]|uniref:SDR family oxidoreductase n=1 Tax=Nannocystis punicea TaxID=2995304 RepID=A0ABY7HJS2_9BACT|nr:SDR family oxidoreductase [Nannocystis poenicansa]WAS99546.1 SDR family oxidoreductase [Nannocystis poenicansa]